MNGMMTEQCPSWCVIDHSEYTDHQHASPMVPFGAYADSIWVEESAGERSLHLGAGGSIYSYAGEEAVLLADLLRDAAAVGSITKALNASSGAA